MMRRISKPLALSLLLLVLASAYRGQSDRGAYVEIEGWDVSAFDLKIAAAAAKAHAIGASPQDKIAAANVYMERANLFYNAGRPPLYKLAVGDFRRVLRLQPKNREAREKLETIVSIYESLGRPVPVNGNEKDIYNDPGARYKLKPQLIKFSPGEKAITLAESLPAEVAYVYEFDSSAGQKMFIKMKVDNGAASFSVYKGEIGNSSQILSDVTEWRGVVPEDGKYLIKVKPKDGAVSYELIVSAE